VDYFGSGIRNNMPNDSWHITNPLQELGSFYRVKGKLLADITMIEQSVVCDKYSIDNIGKLMSYYFNMSNDNYTDIVIGLGELFLEHNDISKILNAKYRMSSMLKEQVKVILLILLVSYNITDNTDDNNRIALLLQKHYAKDAVVKKNLNDYRLIRRAGT
jgi:hypothetical protein